MLKLSSRVYVDRKNDTMPSAWHLQLVPHSLKVDKTSALVPLVDQTITQSSSAREANGINKSAAIWRNDVSRLNVRDGWNRSD